MNNQIIPAVALSGLMAFAGAITFALHRLGEVNWLSVDWSHLREWLDNTPPTEALSATARLMGLGCGGGFSLPPSSIWPRECREPLLLCGSPLPSLSPSFARCSSNRLPPPGSLPLSAPGPQSGWVGEFVDRGYGPCLRDRDESECSLPPSHTRRAISENQYRIVAGDNLWQIAHRILSQFLPHPPTNQQIAGYWMDLIEANEVTLRSGDPNLIHPGETIILSEIRESAQPPLPA